MIKEGPSDEALELALQEFIKEMNDAREAIIEALKYATEDSDESAEKHIKRRNNSYPYPPSRMLYLASLHKHPRVQKKNYIRITQF